MVAGMILLALCALLAEGMERGELRPLEPGPILQSLTGTNVFYFISAPFSRVMTGKDPRDPALLERQRAALLDSAATLLYSDPRQGRLLARRGHQLARAPRWAQRRWRAVHRTELR